eukprot:PhM_4_TR2080/c2_g1_i1/m.72210
MYNNSYNNNNNNNNSALSEQLQWYRQELETLQRKHNDLAFNSAMHRNVLIEEIARYVACNQSSSGLLQAQPLLRYLTDLSNGLVGNPTTMSASASMSTPSRLRPKRERSGGNLTLDSPPPARLCVDSSNPTTMVTTTMVTATNTASATTPTTTSAVARRFHGKRNRFCDDDDDDDDENDEYSHENDHYHLQQPNNVQSFYRNQKASSGVPCGLAPPFPTSPADQQQQQQHHDHQNRSNAAAQFGM